jgi:transcriptional regulator with XRE-family HTH domain
MTSNKGDVFMTPEYSLSCIDVNTLSCLTPYNQRNNLHDMTLGERLRRAREHAGLTQKELEEKSGVLQQMISKVENGRQETSAYVVQLAIACGVRPEWLALGQGEMVAVEVNKSQLTYEMQQVVSQMAAMEPSEQYKVRKMIEVITGTIARNDEEVDSSEGSKRSTKG